MEANQRVIKSLSGRFGKLLGLLLAAAILPGCAGTTTFTSYPGKINPLIASIECGQPVDLDNSLKKESESKDKILYTMEKGRIAQFSKNTEASLSNFSVAIATIQEKDQKAVVSASKIGANIASAAVNDNAIPYEAKGYERVMLHHYQAMNYLTQKDIEGAGVEVRWANMEQEEALSRHQRELEKAQEVAEEKKISDPMGNQELNDRYAALDEIAGKVKNSFQNAYTFYISGLIYEISGQNNDAYIDYKKALEIYPDNKYLRNDVIRLAKKLQMENDLTEFKVKYDLNSEAPSDNETGKGEIIVLFEDGFVPQKQEVKIPLPVPNAGIIAIAFPIYNAKPEEATPLLLKGADEEIGCTDTICDIRALAVKSLKEEIPGIAIRQMIRAITKGAATKLAKEKLGLLGSLTMSAWNLVSENADLRSWLTLPANAQILRARLPAGTHTLTLEHPRLVEPTAIDVDINEGGKTIVHVVSAGNQLYSTIQKF